VALSRPPRQDRAKSGDAADRGDPRAGPSSEPEAARPDSGSEQTSRALRDRILDLARSVATEARGLGRIAKHARLEANRLDPRIAALLGEVRSFDETLQKTRLTLDSLRATERSQRTISYAAQQVHRLEQLASTLATMTASERAGPDALSPDAEEEPRR